MRMETMTAEEWRRERVVIAAAVAVALGRPAAIRSIRAAPGHGAGAWTRQGRLAVQQSHRMPAELVRTAPDRGAGRV